MPPVTVMEPFLKVVKVSGDLLDYYRYNSHAPNYTSPVCLAVTLLFRIPVNPELLPYCKGTLQEEDEFSYAESQQLCCLKGYLAHQLQKIKHTESYVQVAS